MFRFSTRINSHSNTVIDKIFSNVNDPDIMSGNLTATISDHLLQFVKIPNMIGNISVNKWSKYDQENFILDYLLVEGEYLWKIDELNSDNSTKMYLDKISVVRYLCI